MTAAEQAPHPRAGPAQAASNQPVSSSVEIDKTPQFHWIDIDPLPPSPLYSNRRRARFKNKLLSLDSTTISLCLSLFPWAKFRRAKGGVKAHVLLDHDDYLPAYVLISQVG